MEETDEASPRVCRGCGCRFMYPWTAGYLAAGLWLVELRCPNCDGSDSRVLAEDALEAVDRALDDDTRALADDLTALVQANMSAEAERFAAALTAGAILPMDF